MLVLVASTQSHWGCWFYWQNISKSEGSSGEKSLGNLGPSLDPRQKQVAFHRSFNSSSFQLGFFIAISHPLVKDAGLGYAVFVRGCADEEQTRKMLLGRFFHPQAL